MKRVALYVRVSTAEQKNHGLSVDSQIAALREYVAAHPAEYVEVGLYNDAGISARCKYTKRAALLQLMEDCRAGRIDLILFTKLDRWFRSVADYYQVQTVLDECHVAWRSIWEDYETETSSGVFKVNIMLSVAQAESDRTSERIKAVNEYMRSQGTYVGNRVPLGYKVSKGVISFDETTHDAIAAFFDSFLHHFSPIKAIRAAEQHGVFITRPKAGRMLRSKVYAGEASGVSCPAYITLEQYRMISDYTESSRIREVGVQNINLFTSIMRCPVCGGRMKPTSHLHVSSGKKYRYTVYVCDSHKSHAGCSYNKCIYESTAEKFLLANLNSLLEDYLIESKSQQANAKNTKIQISKLKGKLSRIGERYEDGDISREEYVLKRDSIRSEIQALESAILSIPVSLPNNWQESYSALSRENKKAFWSQTIRSFVPVERTDSKAKRSFIVYFK